MRHTLRRTRLLFALIALALVTIQCTGEPEEPQEKPAGTAGQSASADDATHADEVATQGAAGADRVASGSASGTSGSGARDGGNAAGDDPAGGDAAGEAGADGGAAMEPGDDAGIDSAASPAQPPPDDGLPTWTNIYTYVFHSCKNAVCHAKKIAGVDMTSKQAAYDSLVGMPADPTRPCASLGLNRVEPGDPDRSLLHLKLRLDTPCGQQMPPGGTLTEQARNRVRDWILAGAKYD